MQQAQHFFRFCQTKSDFVSSVAYFLQPWFQDGVIAQAANDVAELQGIPYFSSAGNQYKNSWEGTFKGSGFGILGCELHDFGGGTFRQPFETQGSGILVLQWDDPFASVPTSGGNGSTRDVDLFLFVPGSDTPIRFDVDFNIGRDAVAFVRIPGPGTFEIAISLCTPSETPPKLKWIAFGTGELNIAFDTASSTVTGHANAELVAGVGASYFFRTPAFGQSPPLINDFSSRVSTHFSAKPGNSSAAVLLSHFFRFADREGHRSCLIELETALLRQKNACSLASQVPTLI